MLKEIEELAGHRNVSPWIVKLVGDAVAKEREACAKMADSHMDGTPEWNSAANNIAASIRARGQA